jgi:hypothetical protein
MTDSGVPQLFGGFIVTNSLNVGNRAAVGGPRKAALRCSLVVAVRRALCDGVAPWFYT